MSTKNSIETWVKYLFGSFNLVFLRQNKTSYINWSPWIQNKTVHLTHTHTTQGRRFTTVWPPSLETMHSSLSRCQALAPMKDATQTAARAQSTAKQLCGPAVIPSLARHCLAKAWDKTEGKEDALWGLIPSLPYCVTGRKSLRLSVLLQFHKMWQSSSLCFSFSVAYSERMTVGPWRDTPA